MGGLLVLPTLTALPFLFILLALVLARPRNPSLAWMGIGAMLAAGFALPALVFLLLLVAADPSRAADTLPFGGWASLMVLPFGLMLGSLVGGASLALVLGSPPDPRAGADQ